MNLLEGKKISEKILLDLSTSINQNISLIGRAPSLEILLIGDDFASQKYVEMKSKAAGQIGVNSNIRNLPANIYESDILAQLQSLNEDNAVDGIMLQLPLPDKLNRQVLLDAISPTKDVDGLTSANLGLLFKNHTKAIMPATVRGIINLIDSYNIELEGKDVVVVGASDLVGVPLSAVLIARGATVTITHIKTQNLSSKTQQADILVSAVGKKELITGEHVKKDAVIIDVGTSKDEVTNKIVGDVDFDSVSKIASMITPVPGGVGPMTVASLMQNLVERWLQNV